MAFNVLVVDDSEIIRAMIGKTLKLADIPIGEIHEAGNGKEGLEILEENWVDLVFLDVNMPVMSGNEMLVKMKKVPEQRV